MKIRKGFVSNSSSSSFIVAVANIESVDEFEKLKTQFGEMYGVEFFTGTELLKRTPYDVTITTGRVFVSGGGNSGADAATAFHENGNYVIVNINNNEGDSAFMTDEDDYDLDYDIGVDWFSTEQRELIGAVGCIPGSDLMYGAERNG